MKLNFFQWLIVIDVADDVMGAQVNDSTPGTFYIYGFSFYNFGFFFFTIVKVNFISFQCFGRMCYYYY